MAVPKRKMSRSRTRHRKAQWLRTARPDQRDLQALQGAGAAPHRVRHLRHLRRPVIGPRRATQASDGPHHGRPPSSSPPAAELAALLDVHFDDPASARAGAGAPLVGVRERSAPIPTSASSSSATRCSRWSSPTRSTTPTPTSRKGGWPRSAPRRSSTESLAEVARGLGLGRFVRLGRGEAISGGADKDSILADTLEAVLGAAYLDGGFATAYDLVQRLFADRLRRARRAVTPRSTTRPACRSSTAARFEQLPRYEWPTPVPTTTRRSPRP